MWESLITIFGLILEIFGVMLMARRYTNVYLVQVPLVLVSALLLGARSKRVQSSLDLSDMSGDQAVSFLRGLCLVGMGFIVQCIPYSF